MNVTGVAELEFAFHPAATRVSREERERAIASPPFGRVFGEHMVSIRWSRERGWYGGELVPYGPIALDPSTLFFHYGQGIFEGLKAFRQPDGGVALFRVDAHAARFRRSARRLALPELPDQAFIESIEILIACDHEWAPRGNEYSLYLRPFMFASNTGLGVRGGDEARYVVFDSPSGPYFTHGIKPVTVWLSEEYSRAGPGGTGDAKAVGNYAGGLLAQAEAAEAGCDSVVWLDAVEHEWVEEMGGMNLFFVFGSGGDARLVTPPLTGTLLPGITRDSLLRLAPDMGYLVEERPISVEEWRQGCADGTITEVFACGTAAVITPVGEVRSRTRRAWSIGDGSPGPATMKLREALVAIQRGARPDPYGWLRPVSLVG